MPPALKMTQVVTVPLLRYRFDATARMDKHFHEVEGRTLFFFPAASSHKDGSWVFVAFSSGGSCCLFRGRVRTQDSARYVGSWVEFPITGMANLLKFTTQSRRGRERLAADVTVMVRRTDGAKALCRWRGAISTRRCGSGARRCCRSSRPAGTSGRGPSRCAGSRT